MNLDRPAQAVIQDNELLADKQQEAIVIISWIEDILREKGLTWDTSPRTHDFWKEGIWSENLSLKWGYINFDEKDDEEPPGAFISVTVECRKFPREFSVSLDFDVTYADCGVPEHEPPDDRTLFFDQRLKQLFHQLLACSIFKIIDEEKEELLVRDITSFKEAVPILIDLFLYAQDHQN